MRRGFKSGEFLVTEYWLLGTGNWLLVAHRIQLERSKRVLKHTLQIFPRGGYRY